MKKPKPAAVKQKNKGGRPLKVAEFHEGKDAVNRFRAGMEFALAGGPHPPDKSS